MKKTVLLCLVVGALCLLVGCTTTAMTPVYKYQTVLIVPPLSMRQPCPIEPPPLVTSYDAATLSDREALDVAAYNNQTANITSCNRAIERENTWFDEAIKLYPGALVNAATPAIPVSAASAVSGVTP